MAAPAAPPAADSRPHLLVGTAGHIDHGKTRLLEALTGIDCDRWEEEKRRGITIDLGFAHLETPELVLGFVDVPGHTRFLHNALAGLGGIRLVLLVVAADDGVMPQTREHLEICRLLAVPATVVALSKIDRVDAARREEVTTGLRTLLAATPWPAAPVVPVSAPRGEGIPELSATLLATARDLLPEETAAPGPARLPIDRSFVLAGRGRIVTGTLAAGRIAPGDRLQPVPGDGTVRVRGLEVHGRPAPIAVAGQRVALQLAGGDGAELARGCQLARPGSLRAGRTWLVELEALPGAAAALAAGGSLRVHLLTGETGARLRLLPVAGESPPHPLALLRLAAPLAAWRGDRCILRRASPPATLAGARVLDPHWRSSRGTGRRALAEGLREEAGAVAAWVELAGDAGLRPADLALRTGLAPEEAARRLAAGAGRAGWLPLGGDGAAAPAWLHPRVHERMARRAARLLQQHFAAQPRSPGMSAAELSARLLGPRARADGAAHLERLAAAGTLVLDGDRAGLPGRADPLAPGASKLATQLEEAYDRADLDPPSPAALALGIGVKPQIVSGVVDALIARRRLLRLAGGLVVSPRAIERLVARLRASGLDDFPVTRFKQEFGLSRKWAIPLLEHLDARGVTVRLGDRRRLQPPGPEVAP